MPPAPAQPKGALFQRLLQISLGDLTPSTSERSCSNKMNLQKRKPKPNQRARRIKRKTRVQLVVPLMEMRAQRSCSRKMQWSWGLAPLPPWRLPKPCPPSYPPPKKTKVVPKQLADKDEEAIELFEEESDGEITGVDDGDDAPEEDLSLFFPTETH